MRQRDQVAAVHGLGMPFQICTSFTDATDGNGTQDYLEFGAASGQNALTVTYAE